MLSDELKDSTEGLIGEVSGEVPERHNRPTKIVLCNANETQCLTPLTDHGTDLNTKVGITDDGNKLTVKLEQAFYFFPKPYASFSQYEIVLAKLSGKQSQFKISSLKNLDGESVEVPRNKAVALTNNIWKYGVKNKQFIPNNFIDDLIRGDRPSLISVAYIQIPILDIYIPNPFNTSEKKK